MSKNSSNTLQTALAALRSNPHDPEAVIADFEAQAEQLAAEAVALQQIVSGMRTLAGQKTPSATPSVTPDASPPPASPGNAMRPEGMEAVRRIMQGGGVWTSRTVLDELKKRGWESKSSPDPIRPTEAAMNRMWKVKKEIERVGRGQYRYVGDPVAPHNELGLLNGAGGP